LSIQGVNNHKANGKIGGNNNSAPLGKAGQIYRMNTRTTETV